MKKNLTIKDNLYYYDLISELKDKANIEKINDSEQKTRIEERRKIIETKDSKGNLKYITSPFASDLLSICKYISMPSKNSAIITTLNDLENHQKEVLEIIKELEKLNQENNTLLKLINIISNMGYINYFSLGTISEQRVCLTKENNSYQVCTAERGIIYDIKIFEKLENACICVINELSYSDKEFKENALKFKKIVKIK